MTLPLVREVGRMKGTIAWSFAGMLAVLSLAFGLFAIGGCSAQSDKMGDDAVRGHPPEPTVAPTPESWKRVTTRYNEVATGMTSKEVVAILGVPNQITPLYEPEHYRPRTIGRTYVYAKTTFVPPRENREAWLRIDFDKQDRVTGLREKGIGGEDR